jgi:hypothetical protein
MDPAVRSSLLWGLIGALAFLVLVQGYQLLTEEFVGVAVGAGLALLVGIVTAGAAHFARPLLRKQFVR